jgi:hypothetical protein
MLLWMLLTVPLVDGHLVRAGAGRFQRHAAGRRAQGQLQRLPEERPRVFTVYGLFTMVLCFFAALPVGLGFLVLGPVLAGSVYASYKDIFLAT